LSRLGKQRQGKVQHVIAEAHANAPADALVDALAGALADAFAVAGCPLPGSLLRTVL